MAWLEIHEEVDGPKLRLFRKESKLNGFEALGVLVYLWIWGIKNADKSGLLLNAEEKDIENQLSSKVYKRDQIDIENVVKCLISTGWIDDKDGKLYIHDWSEWQARWYKLLETKEKDKARKKQAESNGYIATQSKTDIAQDDCRQNIKEATQEEKNEAPETHKKVVSKEKKKDNRTEQFEEFWKEYPRKVGKGAAYKAYNARLNEGASHAELVQAAKGYASYCKKNGRQAEYIKHPSTFLGPTLDYRDFVPKESTDERFDNNIETVSNPFEEYDFEVLQ